MIKNFKMLFGNNFLTVHLVGVLASIFTRYFVDTFDGEVAGIIGVSQFFIIPITMGILTMRNADEDDFATRRILYLVFVNFIAIMLWTIAIFMEGYICLLIVSPLIFASLFVGGLIGRTIFKKKNKTLNSSVIGLLFVIYLVDILTIKAMPYEVADTLIVNAPPSKVWNNVVAFDEVEDPSEYWLFDIGLPKVVKATVTERKVGGERKCVFENGIAFDEKIVTYDSLRDLTFDIVKMPEDPEIIGHINLKRGQFKLKDNGDGTTTLIGTSWYDLKVFPAWYYNIWAESITREVHLRAMKHIKKLSER